MDEKYIEKEGCHYNKITKNVRESHDSYECNTTANIPLYEQHVYPDAQYIHIDDILSNVFTGGGCEINMPVEKVQGR
jgi:hypothetical protein